MSAIATAEPYKLSAGALALLVHGLFFVMLYFSFNWQMQKPQGMVVDIWESLPVAPEEPRSEPAPMPIEAPPPEKIVELPPKADIELQNKKKMLKQQQLVQEKLALNKLAEKRAEQAERRLDEAERQAQTRSQAQRNAQDAAAAVSGKVVDEYVAKISAKIRSNIVLPPGVQLHIKAEFKVTLLPSGEVLSANRAKSSGNEAYDTAVERAILKAQPLPLPPIEQNLFNKFRDLRLKFTPAESGQ